MKRQLEQLSDNEYDMLIIGGGIFGLIIAWDGALRGLSVALIDKGDFGAATSSNSLRIIHGGFRYLQSLDLINARRFLVEQRVFMKLAPHLVKPMPVLIPIYGHNVLKTVSFKAALRIYDLLGATIKGFSDINYKEVDSRFVSRDECIEMVPNLKEDGLNGAILFNDCQLSNSERFAIEIAHSAFEAGAHLANYVEALSLIIKDKKVKGAAVRDNLTGDKFEIRAKITVNSSGPWLNHLLSGIDNNSTINGLGNSKAFNILINRDLTNGYALGLNTQIKNPDIAKLLSKSSRYLFITPWDGKSLIGTEHLPSDLEPDNFKVTREEISSFLEDINSSYPASSIQTEDVEYVYGGFIPTSSDSHGSYKIGIKDQIHDHEREQGLGGLLSVSGNKYTEARIVAEESVDLIMNKIGKTFRPSMTESATLDFGNFTKFQDSFNPGNNKDNLVSSQIVYAIKEEMAQKLTDVIFRRMDINFDNVKSNLKQYSTIMAKELNWDDSRIKVEEDEVVSKFTIFH